MELRPIVSINLSDYSKVNSKPITHNMKGFAILGETQERLEEDCKHLMRLYGIQTKPLARSVALQLQTDNVKHYFDIVNNIYAAVMETGDINANFSEEQQETGAISLLGFAQVHEENTHPGIIVASIREAKRYLSKRDFTDLGFAR